MNIRGSRKILPQKFYSGFMASILRQQWMTTIGATCAFVHLRSMPFRLIYTRSKMKPGFQIEQGAYFYRRLNRFGKRSDPGFILGWGNGIC